MLTSQIPLGLWREWWSWYVFIPRVVILQPDRHLFDMRGSYFTAGWEVVILHQVSEAVISQGQIDSFRQKILFSTVTCSIHKWCIVLNSVLNVTNQHLFQCEAINHETKIHVTHFLSDRHRFVFYCGKQWYQKKTQCCPVVTLISQT